jgi:hypothetical protein
MRNPQYFDTSGNRTLDPGVAVSAESAASRTRLATFPGGATAGQY